MIGVAAIALSVGVAIPAPKPGRAATLVLLPGHTRDVLAAVTASDPEARLLGVSGGGVLLGIEYANPDLPVRLAGSGVLLVIGTGFVGCHW